MRLIEIVIVVIIVVFLLVTMINVYGQFTDRTRMNAAVENTITLLEKARSNTLAAKGNFLYGVHVALDGDTPKNQLVMFRGNDWTIAGKTIETVPIAFPIAIDSVAIYPEVALDGSYTYSPATNAEPTNQKFKVGLGCSSAVMKDIVFQRITGAVVVDSDCTLAAPGNLHAATSTLNSTIRSSIFFKSQRTNARRAVTILPTGAIYAWELPDAWWPMDEGGSSQSVADASASNLQATRGYNSGGESADPSWTGFSGSKFFNALSFDGTQDFVNIGYSNNVKIFKQYADRGPVTVSAWIRPKDFARWQTIYELGGQANSVVIGITNVGKLRFLIRKAPSSTFFYRCVESRLALSSYIPYDTWGHVAGVYDSAGMTLYVQGNGQTTLIALPVGDVYVTGTGANNCVSNNAASTHTFPFNWQTGDAGHTIGYNPGESSMLGLNSGPTYSSELFSGSIDEVKVWDRALTLPQLQESMNTPYH